MSFWNSVLGCWQRMICVGAIHPRQAWAFHTDFYTSNQCCSGFFCAAFRSGKQNSSFHIPPCPHHQLEQQRRNPSEAVVPSRQYTPRCMTFLVRGIAKGKSRLLIVPQSCHFSTETWIHFVRFGDDIDVNPCQTPLAKEQDAKFKRGRIKGHCRAQYQKISPLHDLTCS